MQEMKDMDSNPGLGRPITWSKKWQPTPIFLPGKFHGHSLAGYSSCGRKESDITEWLSTQHKLLLLLLKLRISLKTSLRIDTWNRYFILFCDFPETKMGVLFRVIRSVFHFLETISSLHSIVITQIENMKLLHQDFNFSSMSAIWIYHIWMWCIK